MARRCAAVYATSAPNTDPADGGRQRSGKRSLSPEPSRYWPATGRHDSHCDSSEQSPFAIRSTILRNDAAAGGRSTRCSRAVCAELRPDRALTLGSRAPHRCCSRWSGATPTMAAALFAAVRHGLHVLGLAVIAFAPNYLMLLVGARPARSGVVGLPSGIVAASRAWLPAAPWLRAVAVPGRRQFRQSRSGRSPRLHRAAPRAAQHRLVRAAALWHGRSGGGRPLVQKPATARAADASGRAPLSPGRCGVPWPC